MRYGLIILFLMLIGCGPSMRSYTITVHNQAPEPMTVWLTKDGAPAELGWLSPEQLVMNDMVKSQITGVVIPSGRTATMTEQTGHFDSGVNAVLRVYRGKQLFNNLLANSSDSPNRTDVILKPGPNQVMIDPEGKSTRK